MKIQEVALLILSFLLGSTFILIQSALHYVDTTILICIRCILAGTFSIFMSGTALLKVTRHDLITGIIIGISLFMAYILQTLGLRYLATSQSAFITAVSIPSVPFLAWAFTKKAPALTTWLAVGCSFAGLIILTGYQNIFYFHWQEGQILTLGAALSIALAVVLTSLFSKKMSNAKATTTVQLLTATVLAAIAIMISHEKLPSFSWKWLLPISALAIISICHRLISNWAQQTVPPTRTALILALEPLWAGLIGWIIGEPFSLHILIGGLLIMIGVIASEVFGRKA